MALHLRDQEMSLRNISKRLVRREEGTAPLARRRYADAA